MDPLIDRHGLGGHGLALVAVELRGLASLEQRHDRSHPHASRQEAEQTASLTTARIVDVLSQGLQRGDPVLGVALLGLGEAKQDVAGLAVRPARHRAVDRRALPLVSEVAPEAS